MFSQIAFAFFLWLHNIPYYVFFIHSTISGHVGSFRILAIVYNATVEMASYYSSGLYSKSKT